jgi:hypothetical protein
MQLAAQAEAKQARTLQTSAVAAAAAAAAEAEGAEGGSQQGQQDDGGKKRKKKESLYANQGGGINNPNPNRYKKGKRPGDPSGPSHSRVKW